MSTRPEGFWTLDKILLSLSEFKVSLNVKSSVWVAYRHMGLINKTKYMFLYCRVEPIVVGAS